MSAPLVRLRSWLAYSTGRDARWRVANWRHYSIAALVGLFLLLRLRWFVDLAPIDNLVEGEHAVARVIDGDTLLLVAGQRVRLIGVDCPEVSHPRKGVEPYGIEAGEFARRVIDEHAGRVTLRFDRERFDNYDRYLAFVWTGDEMLNESLLRAGLARWEPNFSYAAPIKTRFRRAELEARQAQRGVWSIPPP